MQTLTHRQTYTHTYTRRHALTQTHLLTDQHTQIHINTGIHRHPYTHTQNRHANKQIHTDPHTYRPAKHISTHIPLHRHTHTQTYTHGPLPHSPQSNTHTSPTHVTMLISFHVEATSGWLNPAMRRKHAPMNNHSAAWKENSDFIGRTRMWIKFYCWACFFYIHFFRSFEIPYKVRGIKSFVLWCDIED